MTGTGDAEVIKSFLVGLGFGVDDSSLAKFNKAITSATLKITALYASTKVAAAGIVAGISEVSKGFEQMGYEYHIIAPAINKALLLRRELLKSYSLAGINIRQVVKDSIKLNLSLTKTRFAFEAIYKSVASKFFERITKQSDLFRDKIYKNMPRIQRALETFVNVIFRALDITNILGARLWSVLGRVYDFFVMLDNVTNGWSTRILAAVAAWKFLNLSFLATPLGMLFSLGVALLALWDDFQTFREGGQSLINWGSETTKTIVGITAAVAGAAAAIYAVIGAMRVYATVAAAVRSATVAWTAVQWLANAAMAANPIGAVILAVSTLIALLGVLYSKWDAVKKGFSSLGGLFSGIGGSVLNFAGGAPLGANSQNPTTNQNVTQQTTVHVQGVPDANGVGNAVSGVMQKNNFDLVRNLMGSVRAGGELK